MFDFETPYLDMYGTQLLKFKSKPTILHKKTCPICDRKLVNIYYSNKLEKYICKNCMDSLLGEKGGGGLCCENCSDGIAKASLDLINRQKAEIERLRHALENECDHCSCELLDQRDKAGVKAIKEFAEKVKDIVDEPALIRGRVIDTIIARIDDLVKEMTEGERNDL